MFACICFFMVAISFISDAACICVNHSSICSVCCEYYFWISFTRNIFKGCIDSCMLLITNFSLNLKQLHPTKFFIRFLLNEWIATNIGTQRGFSLFSATADLSCVFFSPYTIGWHPEKKKFRLKRTSRMYQLGLAKLSALFASSSKDTNKFSSVRILQRKTHSIWCTIV